MSGENGTANPEEFEGLDENELVEGPDVVVLADEDGNETEFVVIILVEVEDQEYVALTPLEQIEDEESESMEIFLFEYAEDENGVAEFSEIEDEATYIKVRDYCATQVVMDDVEIDVSDN